MKVLMVERFLPESAYSAELGGELNKYCDLTLFSKRGVGSDEYPGLNIHGKFYKDGRAKPLAALDYCVSLAELESEIKHGGYDIVHVQTFKAAKYEIKIYKNTRKHYGKLIHTVHNILPHEAAESDKKMYKNFYGFCDALIVHNEATKARLMEEFRIPDEKIVVIPHGAYAAHMGREGKKKAGGKAEFLMFGNIRKYKGIDILIDAVAAIPDGIRKGIHITIAGEQHKKLDDTGYQAKIDALGLEESITFREGFVPEDEIHKLFEAADAAVFPYRDIYASGALLMAYSYGKPVIASDIPVFEEETGNGRTGLLFESGDIESLAESLMEFAAWDKGRVLGCQEEIKKLVKEKYNWEASAKKTYETYF